jgi:tripeptidyl-peptidase-1
MLFFILLSSALTLGVSIAAPTPHTSHIRHEKRAQGTQLVRRERPPPITILPVRIGISQKNLDVGHERLMEISDPNSDKYGQHLSAKEVGDLFRPSSEDVDSIRSWLHSSGIDMTRHQLSSGRGWIKFEASIAELESLLSTEYFLYHHLETKDEHIGCDEYHVPKSVHPHIDFISPTVSTVKVRSQAGKEKRNSHSAASLKPKIRPANFILGSELRAETEIPCHTAVTPACIRSMQSLKSIYRISGPEFG